MIYRVLNIFLLFAAVWAATAQADPVQISGVAELRYGQHRAKEGGTTVLDSGHFIQKYSILVEKSGLFSKGKLGTYDLALGYEWNSLEATRDNNVTVTVNNPLDKILYKGDLLIAPGGLPFRMHAFSYDLTPTTFIEEDFSIIFRDRSNFSPDGGTVVDFESSKNAITGLSLVAGLKNGDYSGRYRDLLTSMPRLLIDYRQLDVEDTDSLTARNYTDRDLAFVSLNKRDNWFHYRVFTHEDYLDPTQNLEEQTFLLGNINHTNRREWVNMTNWIQVSTDLSYSEIKPHVTTSEQKRYDLNLFSRAARRTWQASNYTTFSRVRDDSSLEKYIDAPFFANGELSKDTSWRYQLQFKQSETDRYLGNLIGQERRGNFYTFLKLETFRQSRQIVSPSLELSVKTGTEGQGRALRVGAELFSNPSYRAPYSTFLKYDVAVFDGKTELDQLVNYFEQTVEIRLDKDLSADARIGFAETLIHGSGEFATDVSDSLRARADGLVDPATNSSGNLFYSRTTAFFDHRSVRQVGNRFELDYQYLSQDGRTSQNVELTHNLTYFGRLWNVRIDNYVFSGTRIASSGVLNTQYDFEAGHESFIEYHPSRQVSTSVRTAYDYYRAKNGGSIDKLYLVQKYEYSFWKNSGLSRKLFNLGEELEYAKYSDLLSTLIDDYVTFSLFGNYYPTRSSLFGARLRYEIDNVAQADTVAFHLLAELDLAKFKLSFNYSYGIRSEGVVLADRTEHRWEAKVKKIF